MVRLFAFLALFAALLGFTACSDIQIIKNDTAGETAEPESRGLTCEQIGLAYTGDSATGCGSPEAGPWGFWINSGCNLPQTDRESWEGSQFHYTGTVSERSSAAIQPITDDDCLVEDILPDDQTVVISWTESYVWYVFHKPMDKEGGGVYWMGREGAIWVVVPADDPKQ